MSANKKSPLFWILVGCGGLMLLAVVAVAGLGIMGYRAAKGFGEQMKDPAQRQAKVLKVLNAESLPEGYYPGMALAINTFFLKFEMAIITDDPSAFQEGSHSGDPMKGKTFLYMLLPQKEKQELRDFLAGKTSDPKALKQNHINMEFQREQVLTQGVYQSEGRDVYYLIQQGSVNSQYGQSTGIQSMLMIDCPGEENTRFAMWMRPVEPEETLTGPDQLAKLQQFLAFFHFCGD